MKIIEHWKDLRLENIVHIDSNGVRIEEKWVDIEDSEGYQVSNFCRIKSLKRVVKRSGKSKKLFVDERIRKQRIGTTGYNMVTLHNKGKLRTMRVHRIAAKAFIPNPNNYPQVNHINSIRTDNTLSNLEWCNNSMNNLHSYRFNNRKAAWTGKRYKEHPLSMPIYQKDMLGNIIKEWSCAQEAADKLGVLSSNISSCANGRYGRKTVGGFMWEFVNDKKKKRHPLIKLVSQSVFCLSVNYKGVNVSILKNGYLLFNTYAKDENEVDVLLRKAARSLKDSIQTK